MAEVVQMSLKEADRYAVIQQVIERTMGQADAAQSHLSQLDAQAACKLLIHLNEMTQVFTTTRPR